jgi:hypothetical protein
MHEGRKVPWVERAGDQMPMIRHHAVRKESNLVRRQRPGEDSEKRAIVARLEEKPLSGGAAVHDVEDVTAQERAWSSRHAIGQRKADACSHCPL